MKQPSHTFYAFVDGFDLDEVAAQLSQELSTFVLGDGWRWQQPAVVNQRHERTPDLGPDDLPTWELGLTFPLPEPGSGRKDWFADVERIASFLGGLHAKRVGSSSWGSGTRGEGFRRTCSSWNPTVPTWKDCLQSWGWRMQASETRPHFNRKYHHPCTSENRTSYWSSSTGRGGMSIC
jgi:hypothetical protein